MRRSDASGLEPRKPDHLPAERLRTPYVTGAIIAANVLIFVFAQGWGQEWGTTYAYALIPEQIVEGADVVTPDRETVDPLTGITFRRPGIPPTPVPVYLTLLTSLFLHRGLAHLVGNMLFLSIFGGNVEQAIGHARFLVLYSLGGVVSGLVHVAASVAFAMNTLAPTLGASGAVSAALGASVLLFPRRWLRAHFFRFLLPVPAFVAVGIWLAFQVGAGLGLFGSGGPAGGVAYGAHIGGLIAGALLVKLLQPRRTTEEQATES